MSEVEELNPRRLIDNIKQIVDKTVIGKVLLRRIASALFFSLYNYWAFKSYKLYNKRYTNPSRASKNQDNFPHSEFIEEMAEKGFDGEIRELYLYRVLADHYALNPTYVTLVTSAKGRKFEEKVYVELNHEKLKELINYALAILSFLEKY